MTEKSSIFEKQINPLYQAAAFLTINVLFTAFGMFGERQGFFREDEMFPWVITATMLLSFAIFNCVFSISYKKQGQYWLLSIISYLLIAVGGGFIAYWFSGISLAEAKSFKWIYVVLGMSYFIFLALIRTIRLIVQIAQKQDARLRGENLEP